MAFVKRVRASLAARVDQLVGEIENHEAVIEAGIRDRRRAYAQAKIRLGRLRQEGEHLRRRIERCRSEASAWRDRALRSEDEEAGLECMRRYKRAAEQGHALTETLGPHAEVERRLAREIERMHQRVLTLEHRRHLLRSREAAADAAVRIRVNAPDTSLDLEDALERWEVRVVEGELGCDAGPEGDSFEASFLAEEERTALRTELAALKAGAQAVPSDGQGGRDAS